jgi:long-chain acyl-CoA synthetase
MAGASVVLSKPFGGESALRFWDDAIRYGADTYWMTPTILSTLVKIDRNPIAAEFVRTRVKTIFSGTAPLPEKVKMDFERKYGRAVFESYGLSELLLLTTNTGTFPYRKNSVGKALPGVGIQSRSDQGSRVEREGELWVSTPFAMPGYWEDRGQDTPFTVDGCFRTGDIGHVDEDGYVFVTGRKKDLIVRGGTNVSPRAVEEALLSHPEVEQAAVVGIPHEFYGEEIVAVLVLRRHGELDGLIDSLRKHCDVHLGEASRPDRFLEMDRLPVNTTGKVLKGDLRRSLITKTT